MDADLQHPPETIPLMIKEATENDNDIVIASRYVDGSMFDNFPGYRHFCVTGFSKNYVVITS